MRPFLSSCLVLSHLPVVLGFVQQNFARPRTYGNGEGAYRQVASSPVSTSSAPDTTCDITAADGETACVPFRHCSTVYMEMTDMYGIVYHANYVTYFKRAIEDACGAPDALIHALHSMKYRAAATLGEVVACTGNLLSSGEGERSRWQFELSDAADPSRVFVSAEAVVSWPGGVALPPGTRVGAPSGERTTARAESQLLQPLPEAFADSRKSLEVVVWSDDLDGGGELSIRAVLNYFLRMTTLRIGRGPDGELGLMRLHREGVSMVVANISDLRVNSKDVAAGDKLDVRVGAKLSRGNRVLTFYESLWTKGGNLVAHAEMSVLCMENESHKLRAVPPLVQEAFLVP